MSKRIQASYWDKNLKKSVWKSTTLKKHDGDEDKAKAFLQKWKEGEIKKMNDKIISQLQPKSNCPNPVIEAPQASCTNEPVVEPAIEDPQVDPVVEPIESPVESSRIQYTKFNLSIAPKSEGGTTTLIFGSSKSGKTTQMLSILNKYYDNTKFITFMICENAQSQIYKKVSKNVIKLDRFDADLINNIHMIQKRTSNKYRFAFILDDIILEKRSDTILKMILTMRNADISTIMLLQSTTLLSKNSRFNINNVIFRRANNMESIEQCLQFFLQGYEPFYSIKSMTEKINLYRSITKEYGYLYLDALNDNLTFHK